MGTTSPPAANTRSKTRERATEHCAQILQKEISPILCLEKTKSVPLSALKELVNAVIDQETGEKMTIIAGGHSNGKLDSTEMLLNGEW